MEKWIVIISIILQVGLIVFKVWHSMIENRKSGYSGKAINKKDLNWFIYFILENSLPEKLV
ncbi:MAG: hypothetical protein HRT68_04155 [Flavobacteriaceae bacterium]|nr:hypothetical protein [Flavobacteriaceae bacterium]